MGRNSHGPPTVGLGGRGISVMVFAVQCPNPKCRKFMLVEEEDQGKVVTCLLCKTPIRIAPAAGSTAPAPHGTPAPTHP